MNRLTHWLRRFVRWAQTPSEAQRRFDRYCDDLILGKYDLPAPRAVDHRPRIEAFNVAGDALLPNGLYAQVIVYPLPAELAPIPVTRLYKPQLWLVMTRWPDVNATADGQAPMPVQLYEGRCASVEAGLTWAQQNYARFANRAMP